MNTKSKEFVAWSKPVLNEAIKKLGANGILVEASIEARVVWGITDTVLVAQARELTNRNEFRWVITGKDYPLDQVPGANATTPREAARHFSLKWQLGAESIRNLSDTEKADLAKGEDINLMTEKLEKQAEALYDITTEDRLW